MSPLRSNDLQRIFGKLDQNGDGYVSVGELSWLLERVGAQSSRDEIESVVGPKSLNLQEFVFFYESISKESKGDDNDLVEAFKVFDLNGDGFISSEELQSVLLRLGLWEEKSGDCNSMIREFDANSDGLLDFQDFKNMILLTNT